MTGSTSMISCRTLFWKLEILTLDFSIHTLLYVIPLVQLGDFHIRYFST